ncbi:MAG: ABA4-like family protein [Pseudomonadota bacterium]
MTLDEVFAISGNLAMVGWVILLFAPRRFKALGHVARILIPVALSAIYAAYILPFFAESGGGYGTLAQVRQLFTVDELLLAGWVHYLAFDLMIGGYLAERMDRIGINRYVQAPILISTLMFGPVGVLLAYGTEAVVRTGPRALRRV